MATKNSLERFRELGRSHFLARCRRSLRCCLGLTTPLSRELEAPSAPREQRRTHSRFRLWLLSRLRRGTPSLRLVSVDRNT